MKVHVNLKVNNANDRAQDRLYFMMFDLQVFPAIGSILVFRDGKEQRCFTVDYFSQVIEKGEQTLPPLVFLRPDNQTFKGASFENLCTKVERLGFTRSDSTDAS